MNLHRPRCETKFPVAARKLLVELICPGTHRAIDHRLHSLDARETILFGPTNPPSRPQRGTLQSQSFQSESTTKAVMIHVRSMGRKQPPTGTRNQRPSRRMLLPILEYQTRPPSCQSSPLIQRSDSYPPVHDKHPAAPSHRPRAATSGEIVIASPCISPKDFSKNQIFFFFGKALKTRIYHIA